MVNDTSITASSIRRSAEKLMVAGIATAAVVATGAIAMASAAAGPGNNPVGRLDSIRVKADRTVTGVGWAFDPDAPKIGDYVDVQIDGRPYSRTATTIDRPDVASTHRQVGLRTGFSTTTRPLGWGWHKVCFAAVNRGVLGANVLLGCRLVNLVDRNNPRGGVKFQQAGNVVVFSGTATDPNTTANIRVVYRLDGRNREAVTTSGHAFNRRWVLGPGVHTIQVFAMNAGGGSGNPLIGQRVVRVAAPTSKNLSIAAYAKTFVGRYPYTSNGASPASGFDCSGLTAYVYTQHGIGLPHSAQAQLSSMRAIPRAQALPGDLVFFLAGGYAFHVGVYEGGNMMVSAATTAEGIKYQAIWSNDIRFATKLH